MSQSQESEGVTYYVVRRTLGEPVYRIRLLYFKLTVPDLFACAVTWTIAVNVSDFFGLSRAVVFGISFDPWGWMFLTFLTASALSLLHHLRPEGHAERIVLGWFAPRFYAPRMRRGDHRWRPSPYRAAARFSATGSDFITKDDRRIRSRRRPN